ncbi:MAG: hypothetical protein CM15mP66_05480 [Pseudomonadota bacterium]|nr:MAG: hypothetical protein CM15mP66_05480 [Pseudomonadota bacterium]
MFILFLNLIIPFRHYLILVTRIWDEVGHYFSWGMMLRQKEIEIRYDISHPVTNEKKYAPLEDYLNTSQIRSFAGNPGMNLQFAHYLKEPLKKKEDLRPFYQR